MDSGSIQVSDFENFMKSISPAAREKLLEGVDDSTLNDKRRGQLIRKGKIEIGRNDPCPCGNPNSKPLKYKNCCLNKKVLRPDQVLNIS